MIGLVSFNNLWKSSSDFASLYRLLGKTCLKQNEEIQVLIYKKVSCPLSLTLLKPIQLIIPLN